MPPKRVAIIGGGCAGISSLWALRDSGHEVHLFESSDKLGGRLKTLPFEESGRRIDVDTGPVFFNAHASRQCDQIRLSFFHADRNQPILTLSLIVSDCTRLRGD